VKEILNSVDKATEQVNKMTDKMDEKGVKTTLSAIVAVVFIGLILMFGVIFYQKVIPDDTGMREELALMRNEITVLHSDLNKGKKLGLDDFKMIAPLRTHASILEIYRRIADIIDNNNIVRNIDLIENQVSIIVNTVVDDGRAYLITLNFEDGTVEKLTAGTDALKKMAIDEMSRAFRETSEALLKIHKELKDCEDMLLGTPMYTPQLILSFLNKRNEILEREKHEYYKLKRRIWAVFENIQTGTVRHIRSLK
jgi:hypothetical protein